MRPVLLPLLAALSIPLLAQDPPCTADRYKIVAIPIVPAAINDSGVIAGTTSRHRAALWTEKKGTAQVPLPAGYRLAESIGINARAQLIGSATNDSSSRRLAFLYREGKLVLLPGLQSKATAINDAGDIAGEANLPGNKISAPVLWKKQSLVGLGGCCGGTALGLNNHGQVVGQVYDQHARYHAFLWDLNQGLQNIGPPGVFSSAVTINDSGDVLIQQFAPQKSLLYSNRQLTPLSLSAKFPSRPRAMNQCDAIVGSFGPFADAEHAFLWDPVRGFRDLNDLIPKDSGWKLETATGINNHGQIVGWGDFRHADNAGFLLIPVRQN